jgi:hypothetical protein
MQVTISEQIGWIFPNQICDIIEETSEMVFLECFDGYDGTIKREWIDKKLIVFLNQK